MKLHPIQISFKALRSRWFQKSFLLQSSLFLIALGILSFGVRQSLRFYLYQTASDYGLHQIDAIKEFPELLSWCTEKKWNQIDPTLEISIHQKGLTLFCKDNNTYGPKFEFLQSKNSYSYFKKNNQNQSYLYVGKKILRSKACNNCVIQIGLPLSTYQPLLLKLDQILIPFSLSAFIL